VLSLVASSMMPSFVGQSTRQRYGAI